MDLYRYSISYIQLIYYGVHIGHSFRNSLLFASWLIYTFSQNIYIINLFKTLILWKMGLLSLKTACYYKSPIWFINLDQGMSLYVKLAAYRCGEISWTKDWVNGMLANFSTFVKLFRRLCKYSTLAYKGNQRWTDDVYHFFFSRLSWPRSVFVSSVYNSYAPVKEAINLGIPCLGITDTNVIPNYISIPVPGNDDSLDCLTFYIL